MSARSRKAALEIVGSLRERGHAALFAGGCVRDELLGDDPKDYDVATSATPEEIEAIFRRTRAVGKSFGVMQVRHLGVTVEVATFRRESGYSDRRRPDRVEFSDARSDAERRDLTINALFIDPLVEGGEEDVVSPRGGVVIDYVEGVADLRAGVIRAVGDPDQRFSEDDLRALRAIRFAARLGFRLEEKTAEAIARHAPGLEGVSRERVGDEVRMMMSHPRRGEAARLIERFALDHAVLGEEVLGEGELPLLSRLRGDAPHVLALAAWMVDRVIRRDAGIGKLASRVAALVPTWRASLCLSNEETHELRSILAGDARPGGLAALAHGGAWDEWGVAGRKRAASSAWFEGAMELLHLLDWDRWSHVSAERERLASTPGGLAPEALLNGDDLVREGLRPGPSFGRWLDRVYDEQLEGRIATRDEAIELVKRWASGADSGRP